MNEPLQCPRCGSGKVVPRATIIDTADHGVAMPLRAVVARDPDTLLFKERVYTDLQARICGSCGFTEIYAAQPLAFYNAYLAGRENANF